MKIAVPTRYAVDYVKQRHRTVETVMMQTVMEVGIPECGQADAPVVHVAGEALRPPKSGPVVHIDRYTPFSLIDGSAPEIRFYEGSYYVQRCNTLQFVSSLTEPGTHNLFSGYYRHEGKGVIAGQEPTTFYSSANMRVYAGQQELEDDIGCPVKKWEPRPAETHAALSRRAGDLLVIDSWVYERVGEPVLTVFFNMNGDGKISLGISQATVDDGFSKGYQEYHHWHGIRFGLDELDKARETGKRLAAAAGTEFLDNVEIEHVSIDAVRFRGEPEFFAHACRSFVDACASFVPYMERTYALAWHDLSEAVYARNGPSWKAVDAARAICEMERVSRDGNRGPFRGKPGYPTIEVTVADHAAELLQEALRMWEERTGPECGIEWIAHPSGLMSTATYDRGTRAWEIQSLMEADCVSRSLGCPVPGHAGRPGDGWAVAVEDREHGVRAAFLVEDGPDGPTIIQGTSRNGTVPSARYAALALSHVSKALECRPSDMPDIGLYGL